MLLAVERKLGRMDGVFQFIDARTGAFVVDALRIIDWDGPERTGGNDAPSISISNHSFDPASPCHRVGDIESVDPRR